MKIVEFVSTILSLFSLTGFLVGLFLWRRFLPAYATEKAKNQALKEDLTQLTNLVEGIKTKNQVEIEQLKATLASEAVTTERRRKIYEEIASAMLVFIQGYGNSSDAENKYHSAYATAWLWASDEVLDELNKFISLQLQHAADRESVSQEQLKSAYISTVLAMRKDAGFPSTKVKDTTYQFVRFE